MGEEDIVNCNYVYIMYSNDYGYMKASLQFVCQIISKVCEYEI